MNITNILVVDDDVAVCRILHRMLSDERYQVQISSSVTDAVATIEEKLFDVYIVDYKLKDGTGLDVAERIRSKGSEAPIILISGYDPSAVALRAEKLRISDIIEKPFSRAMIVNAVKKAIGFPTTDPANAEPVTPSPSVPVSPRPEEPVAKKKGAPKAAIIAFIILLLLLLACVAYYLLTNGH
jgi:DNA-binding NtrC family response regulator